MFFRGVVTIFLSAITYTLARGVPTGADIVMLTISLLPFVGFAVGAAYLFLGARDFDLSRQHLTEPRVHEQRRPAEDRQV